MKQNRSEFKKLTLMDFKNMIVSSATTTWLGLKNCLKLLTVPYQTFFLDDIGFYIVVDSLDEQVHAYNVIPTFSPIGPGVPRGPSGPEGPL